MREYFGCKLNVLAKTPVVLAVRLASLGLSTFLCTTFDTSMILQERNLVRWVAMRDEGRASPAGFEPTLPA